MDDMNVDCVCGFRFCLGCGQEEHPVVSCDMLRLWNEKCVNESETAHWVMINTKKCPSSKCGVRIEKNQGCNHMTCKSCRYEFCWICMESWRSHFSGGTANYSCNRFNKTAAADTDLARAKTELERYLHFNERYSNHAKSETICVDVRKKAELKSATLEEMTIADYQYVQRALDLLIRCRRTLKYTYVFGYYMNAMQENEKDLFEFLQAQVESNTEHLTELTEHPLESMEIAEIMNYTSVTAHFLKSFIDGVESGLSG